jgi:hypothetical protein
MTVTELRQTLERLEAEGKGSDRIGIQTYEDTWDFPDQLQIATIPRWREKHDANTSWRELTDEHWIKLEDEP